MTGTSIHHHPGEDVSSRAVAHDRQGRGGRHQPAAQLMKPRQPQQPQQPQQDVVQARISYEDESGSPAFAKAFTIFEAALRQQGGKIKNYLDFVDDPRNNHNLRFKTIAPPRDAKGELHGVTHITFSGGKTDIVQHMFDRNLMPNGDNIDEIMKGVDKVNVMNGVDVYIEIVLRPTSDIPIITETLNHEFTVHAIKWYEFINSVYDGGNVMAELKKRLMDMPNDHDEFGRNGNAMYEAVKKTMIEAVSRNEIPDLSGYQLSSSTSSQMREISRQAIHDHKPPDVMRRELDEMKEKTGKLTDPLLPKVTFKKKEKPPEDKCCYITTACIQARGLPDDCEELTVLRRFRDDYLRQKANGDALIGLYYQYSPLILANIRRRDDEEEILKRLYGIIRQCVDAILRKDNEFAYRTYCDMVIRLKDQYAPELDYVRIP